MAAAFAAARDAILASQKDEDARNASQEAEAARCATAAERHGFRARDIR